MGYRCINSYYISRYIVYWYGGIVYGVVYGSMIYFYSIGRGRECGSGCVATSANIMRVDSVLAILL